MSLELNELHPVLQSVRTRPLFVMHLDVRPILVVGDTPNAFRRVGVVYGGQFKGERLSGTVLDGGNDFQAVRSDGSLILDVRLMLKTDDGALITAVYHGMRHGPANVLARVDAGEAVSPDEYYFRTNPMFETASENHAWLNRVLAVGIGFRQQQGAIYSLFEVL
jgi:hypothetical protein